MAMIYSMSPTIVESLLSFRATNQSTCFHTLLYQYIEQLTNLMLMQTFGSQLLCVLIDMTVFGLNAEVNAECHISMRAR